jgi:RHS repeat-associated protein
VDEERKREGQHTGTATSRRTGPDPQFALRAPAISLPKGGGALRGLGEKFATNPVTGTASLSVPIAVAPGRSGFQPQLTLSYDSGAGNGPFGFGWHLDLAQITRKTSLGLPRYADEYDSDTFIISGAEDLVPVRTAPVQRVLGPDAFSVRRYRPRIEADFTRIERWTHAQTGRCHWRTISRDNVTTIYGFDEAARIADPQDATRIFSWLISHSYDDRGNVIAYVYKREDSSGLSPDDAGKPGGRPAPPDGSEFNRLRTGSFVQRYPKQIRYGNVAAYDVGEDLTKRSDWLFDIVFDYGEHDSATPTLAEPRRWSVRQDAFSSYRATFELRTYRLCRRILVFHHFPSELGLTDCLVRSTDLAYAESPVASFLTTLSQAGYVWQSTSKDYRSRSLPALTLGYTPVQLDETVHEVGAADVTNLAVGTDALSHEWIDLDSEGLPGMLIEQADTWYYKRNLGDGKFAPLETVARRPATARLGTGSQQLMDLEADGQLQLVAYDGAATGFYRRSAARDWETFTPFRTVARLDLSSPNLRFIDLTGDGRADVLISEDTAFTWFESQGMDGFAPGGRTPQPWDEERGPKLLFADVSESIFLADFAGDGLADLVRIRSGEVCYWPNLGFGRFGAKVNMGNAPRFDTPDRFDPRRLRLADIDGSGCTDLIYLGADRIDLYFNQSGNSWSAPRSLEHFPRVDDLTAVSAFDLRGNGTACLVWSSPLAPDAGRPLRFIDLMGSVKPHLLRTVDNQLGVQTTVEYSASTRLYVQDRLAGRSWKTRLPFPVQVVTRVQAQDAVSNTTLTTTYRYRHGYYDRGEREFRGFAYVEQRDAESFGGVFDLPPILTKTWFHVGAYAADAPLEAALKAPGDFEFFGGDPLARVLPVSNVESVRETGTNAQVLLTPAEAREACRALRGNLLRQEVYAEDRSSKASVPYSVAERNYAVSVMQRRSDSAHAVFHTSPRESIDWHYERNASDPRTSHGLVLQTDDYGNVVQEAHIAYARRAPQFPEQGRVVTTLTRRQYTNVVDTADAFRVPLASRERTYELTDAALSGPGPLSFEAVSQLAGLGGGTPAQLRLVQHTATRYRADDLASVLGDGVLESRALLAERYQQAFTKGMLGVLQAVTSAGDAASLLTGSTGGYVDLDVDGALWIRSGMAFLSPGSSDAPSVELAFAEQHFFLPHRFVDAFGNTATIGYDSPHVLFPVLTRDALGNEAHAAYDYRVLQPRLMTDANGNQSLAHFDALGLLTGTAVQGKNTGPVEGDSFATFVEDLAPNDVNAFITAPDPVALAVQHLGTATTRIIYDMTHVPMCSVTIARERHVSDPKPGGGAADVQISVAYWDGFGRMAQSKTRVARGPLDPEVANSPTVDPRWAVSGARVYNNKGNVVREYEPYFSATHQYVGVEPRGVSGIAFFDPLSRVVARVRADNSYEKMVFDAWKQTSWDANDSCAPAGSQTGDPRSDPDIKERVAAYFASVPAGSWQTWYAQRIALTLKNPQRVAAEQAAKHADTPLTAHVDALGRTFLSVADNGPGGLHEHRIELDVQGNELAHFDPLGRKVVACDYNMISQCFVRASMEAGTRWTLLDGTGKALRSWDSRGHVFWVSYDALQRPVGRFVRGSTAASDSRTLNKTVQFELLEYGEQQAAAKNLRGRLYRHCDTTGRLTFGAYDFKGNALTIAREVVAAPGDLHDWSGATLPTFVGPFATATAYDALNRVISQTAPDGSLTQHEFDAGGQLTGVSVQLPGGSATPIVKSIEYNAKRQRLRIEYGNKATTTECRYETDTFRLRQLTTTRVGSAANARTVQDLTYTYDAVGNVTHIQDDADIQNVIYFRNQRVEPSNDYRYDALYRLVSGAGREWIGGTAAGARGYTYNDADRMDVSHPGDGNQVDLYTETFLYDKAGNLQSMQHALNKGGTWTRTFQYLEDSQLESGKFMSNRLSLSSVGGSPAEKHTYDAHGNVLTMAQLQRMEWDFVDRLSLTQRQAIDANDADGVAHAGEVTYYTYDASGERVRKVTRRNGNTVKDRIYFGAFESYREYGAQGAVTLERNTLHVMDDKRRIALIERRVHGNNSELLTRYQFANHLGSACLELDDNAEVISYEEYSPYGSTTYQATNKAIKQAAKRYRYTGKERDEETGLNYHSARYYAPWLARWIAPDPSGVRDSLSLYECVRLNPARYVDLDGRKAARAEHVDFSTSEADQDFATVSAAMQPKEPPRTLWKGREAELMAIEQMHAAPRPAIDAFAEQYFAAVGIAIAVPMGFAAGLSKVAIGMGIVGGELGTKLGRRLGERVTQSMSDRNEREFVVGLLSAAGGQIGGAAFTMAASGRGGGRNLPESPPKGAPAGTGKGASAPLEPGAPPSEPAAPPSEPPASPPGSGPRSPSQVPKNVRDAYFRKLNETGLPTEAGKAAHAEAGAAPQGADFFFHRVGESRFGAVLNELKTLLTSDAKVAARLVEVRQGALAQSWKYSQAMQSATGGLVPIRTVTIYLMRQNIAITR